MQNFEELAFEQTPMGELTLRRRFEPAADAEVFEVKLGDEYLMSSLFTVAEEALADLGLAAIDTDVAGEEWDVLVGGLGLGYTAVAALRDRRVRSLNVVDALPEVIHWHSRQLLPVSAELVDDTRTRLAHVDFFALMRGEPDAYFDLPAAFHAILLDVDHTPSFPLAESHRDLYTADGLRRLVRHLAPGGVFALWSDEVPEAEFLGTLAEVFVEVHGHIVPFANPITGGTSQNGVYVARTPR
ncbi:spermidine synthase [Microcella alkalica]|uniref:Spermidine synthase n=1 Tax=Microcella alkalica TaxID=355930 RepID=A0A839E5U8_9MICO|nr:spermidine synthase [Microcella alkalica]MBA8847761.1 spermidine synthase [Microcella alkalica]